MVSLPDGGADQGAATTAEAPSRAAETIVESIFATGEKE